MVLAVVVGRRLVARSPVGLRIGIDARALSGRLMLGVPQITSEFEREV